MKYQIQDIQIPQDKRKEINDKILHIINNDIQGVLSQQDVFTCYTGDGGTFDIKFKDYSSFHAYSEAKKVQEQGQFFTPYTLSKFLVDCIKPSNYDLVGDLTCGHGSFINFVPIESNFYGCELDVKAYKITKHLYPDANIKNEDIRYYNTPCQLDIVFLNPPFNLKWQVNRDDILSQLYCVQKAAESLKPSGILGLIVPESFLKDDFSDKGMIDSVNEIFNFVVQFDLPRDVFKGVGVDNFKTKIMIFQKKSEHIQDKEYKPSDKIVINNLNESTSDYIYNTYVKPLIEIKEKIKGKLYFETLHNSDSQEDIQFQVKVKKLLYDIKRNPKVNKYYGKSLELISKLNNQKKPEEMDWKEWDKKKLTKNKVLSQLKGYLRKQNENKKDEIRLVKSAYGLKLKGYNRSKKVFLSKYTGIKEMSFNDMILNGNYPFEDQTYKKLYEKKRREYLKQGQSFKEMQEDNNIKEWLDNLTIRDYDGNFDIKLKTVQKECVGKLLQKRYGILNTTMGNETVTKNLCKTMQICIYV